LEKNLQANEAWLGAHASTLSQPEVAAAQLQMARAGLLAYREDYEAAEPLARAAWQRTRKALGDDGRQALSMRMEYAMILADMGRVNDGVGHTQAVVAGLRRARPLNEFRLANALNNLAVAKDRASKSAEAVLHDEESLAIRRRILPPGHHYIALSLGNLAIHMDNSGRNKEALPLHAQAVAIYRALPPPGKQGELAAEMNNWGLGCYYLGDMPCAIEKMLEATAIWSRELPADHGNLLTARTNLAALYSRSGMLPEGEAQLRQALAALEAAAKRSPNADVLIGLSSARNELTDNLLAQQRYPEALQVARQRLRDVQGGADMDEAAVLALAMLALTELANGMPAEALAHARTAQARAHAEGAGSRREAFAVMTMARAELASGDAKAAAADARKAVAMFTKALSADHRDTGLARGVLGRALLASNQRDEARKELDAAIAILADKAAWLPERAELKRLR
jgi:tetratricopeptide (TPR) repeat protein